MSQIITYSQNFEDILLNRCFKDQSVGSYIDIGSHHPIIDSVSFLFYKKGWSGINIDANAKWIEENKKIRPKDQSLNYCIYNKSGESINFYNQNHSGLSGIYEPKNVNYTDELVVSITMDDLIKQYKKKYPEHKIFDFIKVDVEGAEKLVFEGWNNFNSKLILFESHNLKKQDFAFITQKLNKNNFEEVYYDGINTFFLNNQFLDLKDNFLKPVNVTDNFLSNSHINELEFKENQFDQLRKKTAYLENFLLNTLIEIKNKKSLKSYIASFFDFFKEYRVILIKVIRFFLEIKVFRLFLIPIFKKIFPYKNFYKSYINLNTSNEEQMLKYENNLNKTVKKRLFVDFSQIIFKDLKTGIQRVSKNILFEVFENIKLKTKYDQISIVFQNRKRNRYEVLKISPEEFRDIILRDKNFDDQIQALNTEELILTKNDVFFGLDYCVDEIIDNEVFLKNASKAGCKIYFLIYDLLTITNKKWFDDKAYKKTFKWVKLISQFDGAFCISKNTRDQYLKFLKKNNIITNFDFITEVIPMGIIQNTQLKKKLDIYRQNNLIKNASKNQINFLIISTLEPRKGYDQMINVFNEICAIKKNVHLTIIGKYGWKSENILKQISGANKNINYLGVVNDFELLKNYVDCDALIMPSYDEGFGLPLIEVQQYDKFVICRNIPVFREVLDEKGYFFPDSDTKNIKRYFLDWIEMYENKKLELKKINSSTWKNSVEVLEKFL